LRAHHLQLAWDKLEKRHGIRKQRHKIIARTKPDSICFERLCTCHNAPGHAAGDRAVELELNIQVGRHPDGQFRDDTPWIHTYLGRAPQTAQQAIRFLKALHGALDSLDEEALAAAQASHDALAAQRLVQKVLLSSMSEIA